VGVAWRYLYDHFPLRCGCDGMAHHVVDNLTEAIDIANQHVRHLGIDATDEFEPFLMCLASASLKQRPEALAETEGNGNEWQGAGLELRKIQQVITHL
jgi:hypothetical protein